MGDTPLSRHLIFGSGYPAGESQTEPALVHLPTRHFAHGHFIGKTGHGKSSLIASLFVQLLAQGVSTALVEPAALVRHILKLLIQTGYFAAQGAAAFDQLLYLPIGTAAKRGLFLPANVLNMGYDPHTTAATVLEAFRRAWPPLQSGTASNIELLIKACAYVLAVHQLPLFPYMRLLLTNQAARDRLLSTITDEEIQSAFALYGLRRDGEVRADMRPTIRRLLSFLLSPLMRYSFGQQGNVLDVRRIIDTNQSVLLNLNVSDLDAMRMLGCFYTVFAELAGRARREADAQELTGRHILFLDEFQNWVAHSGLAFRTMFEQMRAAGMFLVVAHQDWEQVPAALRGALNQCDIRVVFHLDEPDAVISAPVLGFPYNPYKAKPALINPLRPFPVTPHFYSRSEQQTMYVERITRLARQEAYVQLPNRPLYKMRSLQVDPPRVPDEVLEEVQQQYFARYFRSKEVIEVEIKNKMNELGISNTADDTINTVEDEALIGDDGAQEEDFYGQFSD